MCPKIYPIKLSIARLIDFMKDWTWLLWGKHPSFSDYIQINNEDPITNILIGWIQKVFPADLSLNENKKNSNFFRFWIVQPDSHTIILGTIMKSKDSASRACPLLCALKGGLSKNLFKRWETISIRCAPVWESVEQRLRQQFTDMKELKSILKNIKPPDSDTLYMANDTDELMQVRKEAKQYLKTNQMHCIQNKFLHFSVTDHKRSIDGSLLRETAVREILKVMPFSVFIRKRGSQTHLYMYYRAIMESDIRNMWMVNPYNAMAMD